MAYKDHSRHLNDVKGPPKKKKYPNPQGRGRSVEGSVALNRPSYDLAHENTKDPPRRRRGKTRRRSDQWYNDGSVRYV